MSSIINIDGFRCSKFAPSHEIIVSGEFDVNNPCTWCDNRKHRGRRGPAFLYLEYGHWEFPFIAEANCLNFSLVAGLDSWQVDPEDWKNARRVHEQRNRIAEIGRRYAKQWGAYKPNEVPRFMGETLHPGQVIYPSGLSASDFFKQASNLRSDVFELTTELRDLIKEIKRRWGIQDSRIEHWLRATSKQMSVLTVQIDELESRRETSPFSVFSKWGFNTISGGVAWEGLKSVAGIIRGILSKF